MSPDSHNHGFVAVPADPTVLFGEGEKDAVAPTRFTFDDLTWPDTELVKVTRDFVKAELNEPTFNHSERVFYIGQALARDHFPKFKLDLETYYLTCLFHDIGVSKRNLHATKMSFEFYGGIVARDWLLEHGAPKDVADSVAETIFRHTDFVSGSLTLHGQVIQLATILDNLGDRSILIHKDTYGDIVARFHREGWSNCFADTMQEELDTKPWSHTTALLKNDFVNAARRNPYGKLFEKN